MVTDAASPVTVIVSASLMDTDDMEVVPSGSIFSAEIVTSAAGMSPSPLLASSLFRHHLTIWGKLIPIAENTTATITKTRPLRLFRDSEEVSSRAKFSAPVLVLESSSVPFSEDRDD